MVNYGNGLIYKLCCKDINIKDEYVGSSVDFTERKRCHKNQCNNPNGKEYNFYVYKFIRDNGGFENWQMVLVEKFPCESKLQLKQRERHWIETLESKLNSNIPTRTKKEYNEEHKDEIKEQKKVYYEEHKDEIKERKKVYYEEHKDEIKERKKVYRDKNRDEIKEQKKVYYEEHIDEFKERNKEYYYHNKDEILEKSKEKITCECGAIVCKNHISRHRITQKHLKLLEKNKNEK